MRRFMPDAGTLIVAAAWLVGQCTVFVRHREQLANPPVSLSSDQATIEWLTALISSWALAGLAHAQPEASVKALLPMAAANVVSDSSKCLFLKRMEPRCRDRRGSKQSHSTRVVRSRSHGELCKERAKSIWRVIAGGKSGFRSKLANRARFGG
jgi:hypothetical protein